MLQKTTTYNEGTQGEEGTNREFTLPIFQFEGNKIKIIYKVTSSTLSSLLPSCLSPVFHFLEQVNDLGQVQSCIKLWDVAAQGWYQHGYSLFCIQYKTIIEETITRLVPAQVPAAGHKKIKEEDCTISTKGSIAEKLHMFTHIIAATYWISGK